MKSKSGQLITTRSRRSWRASKQVHKDACHKYHIATVLATEMEIRQQSWTAYASIRHKNSKTLQTWYQGLQELLPPCGHIHSGMSHPDDTGGHLAWPFWWNFSVNNHKPADAGTSARHTSVLDRNPAVDGNISWVSVIDALRKKKKNIKQRLQSDATGGGLGAGRRGRSVMGWQVWMCHLLSKGF